jgi:tetrapyrrole methylase family protein/MazG family protein
MSTKSSGITLLGLGPGDPAQITREAWELISSSSEIYLRTKQHPMLSALPDNLTLHSFDQLYDSEDDVEKVYASIVDQILELGRRPEGVIYAVPGHPFVAESTAPEIARRANEEALPVRIVQGLSFIEPTLAALGIDLLPQSTVTDALELLSQHHPLFPPSSPVLIAQIHSKAVASEVKLTLMSSYPDEHPVQLVHAAGTMNENVENLPLYEIDRSEHISALTSLYLPPLPERTSFEEFQNLIAHLRSPEGCPWDREQTHQSLRRNLVEESYEVLEALDSGDESAMQEEFGDLLVQIVLHAQIAAEAGEFRMADVIEGIHTKLVNRHPHVFGDTQLDDAQDVINNWEHLKSEERRSKGQAEKGMLDSVAQALPALAQAEAYGTRAARAGFDWPDISGVMDKLDEEIEELRSAENAEDRNAEFGDLLFALVNLARWLDVDPETALRGTNARFKQRFAHIEGTARKQGRKLKEMELAEMEALWEEGKNAAS